MVLISDHEIMKVINDGDKDYDKDYDKDDANTEKSLIRTSGEGGKQIVLFPEGTNLTAKVISSLS